MAEDQQKAPTPSDKVVQEPGAKPAGAPAPYVLDQSVSVEDSWVKYLDAARVAYAFADDQVKSAQSILDSCKARADKLRKGASEKQATAAVNAASAGKQKLGSEADLTVGLSKLTDEFIYRIDAIARIDQVMSAETKGFVSPRKKVTPLKPEPGNPAPDFTLKDADGKDVSLKDLKGKVTVITFWASWCGYCKKALPDIQKLHEEFNGKPVLIYGINCREKDGTNQKAKDVLTQGKYTFPVLYNGDAVSTLYDVQGFPTLYVVGPDGKIIHKIRGAQANLATTLRPIIESAIKKS